MKKVKNLFRLNFPRMKKDVTFFELQDGRFIMRYEKDNEVLMDVISKEIYMNARIYKLLRALHY